MNNDGFLRRQQNLVEPSQHSLFDPNNIDALNNLCARLPISQIVVTSTWREDYTIRELADFLSEADFSQSNLVCDTTPIGQNRVEEITLHLAQNDVSKFLILDDMSLDPMTPPQFFHVRPATGLTHAMCDEILVGLGMPKRRG